MQNVLFIHESDATDYLRVVVKHLISQTLFLTKLEQKILEGAIFTQLHHQEDTILAYFVVDVANDVGMG